MKQRKLFGLLIVIALIAIILLGSSPTSAAPVPQAATQTRTAAATAVITPTNTTVPPAGKSVITPTATTVVTPTKTSTAIPPTATLPKPTATQIVTATAKPTTTITPTAVVTPTATVTKTATITPTATVTKTATITPTATVTKTATVTPTKPMVLAPRAGTVAALSTAFTVQNMDTAISSTLTASFYDTAGNPVGSGVTCSNVLPYRNCTVDQRLTGGGLDGLSNWQGSVVLSSNTQLAAVVSEYAGNAASLGLDFRADTYAGWSSVSASTSISMPQLLKNVFDSATNSTFNSTVAIQNTSPTTPANVTIAYKTSGGVPFSRITSIPANSSEIINLQSESALSGVSVFYGTGTVTSDLPVGVIVHHNAAGLLQIYSGFAASNAANTLYEPQLLRNVFDTATSLTYGSGILVMVADGTSTNVTLTYTSSTGQVYSESQMASPMATFDQRFSSALPSFFYGSGTLSASKPILAIVTFVVNYDAARGLRSNTYRAFPVSAGGTTVFVPLLRKNAFDVGTGVAWGTGVLGRLMGGSATTVTVTLYHSNGNTYVRTVNISPASPMFTLDQRFDATLPDGTMSAVLTSSPAQPIVVIVNTVGPSSVLGDASMTYSGIVP